jgi:hypothetical protein
MDVLIGIFVGFIFGAFLTFSYSDHNWENRLIKAELAEFTVDSTTGDTTFIIYSEQLTK